MLLTWWRKLTDSRSQGAKRRQRLPAVGKPFRGLHLERLEDRLALASHTWTGAAGPDWSDNANWKGGSPAGDPNADLVFPDGAQNVTNSNNIAALTVRSITFSGSGYVLGGDDGITLNMGITVTSTATDRNKIELNIVLGAPQVIDVMGYGLNLLGIISGPPSSSLTKEGPGDLSLENKGNTYAGDTILNGGALGVFQDNVLGNGTLSLLAGTLENGPARVTLDNPFSVETPLPGSSPAAIDDSGSFTFTGNGELAMGTELAIGTHHAETTTFEGVISGPGSLDENGAGTLILKNVNAYTGSTDVGAGVLQLQIANAIPDGSAVAVAAGATLDLNNLDDTVGSLEGAGNVTLGAGTLTTGGNNANTTFSGVISGSGAVIKEGTGKFTLSSANTYTGGTRVNSGSLSLGTSDSVGPAGLILNGGNLLSAVPLSLSNSFSVSGSSEIGGGFTLLGPGTFDPGSTLVVNSAIMTTFANTLSGQGSISVTGSGTVMLAAANSYTGTTHVIAGTLRLGTDNAIPSLSAVMVDGPGGRLNLDGYSDTIASLAGSGNVSLGNGILTIGDSSSTVFSGTIQGQDSSGLVKTGSGMFTLATASPFFSGRSVLAGGLLDVGNNLALGTGLVVLNGGNLADDGPINLNNPLYVNLPATIEGDSNFSFSGMGSTLASTLTVKNTALTTFAAPLGGGGSVEVAAGSGTVRLLAANNFWGQTTIRSGTLQQGLSGALSPFSAVVMDEGILDLNGFDARILSLAGVGSVSLGAGTLTVGDNTSTAFEGVIRGSGGLLKVGSGELTLMNRSTYLGATVIAQGTLQLAADDTLPVTSNVTVAAGATLDVHNGQNDFKAGSSIVGTGSVSFSGGTANIAGIFDLTVSSSGTQIIGGVANFLRPVTSLGKELLISDGQGNFGTGAPILVPTLVLSGGVLGGSDAITVASQMSWTGGHMNGSGSIAVDSGSQEVAQLTITGDVPKYLDSRTLNIRPSGNVIWGGTGGIWIKDHSSVNNAGTFNAASGNHFVFNGEPGDTPQVNNSGTFVCNGSITVDSGVRFTNMGIMQIASGMLDIGDDYTQKSGSTALANGAVLKTGGTVNINGGVLSGSGTVSGNVINAGEIDPGDDGTTGILTITGDYTQEPSGVLNIRIGGNVAGPGGYDQLLIGGRANLNGALKVSLSNNFMPTSGSTFQIMLFTSLSGAFADTTNVDPSFMPPVYDPTDVTLQAN